MIVVAFVACVAACVVAQLAILRSIVHNRSAAASAGVPRPRLFVEVIWAVLPALALALLLTATWARVRDRSSAPPPVLRVAR